MAQVIALDVGGTRSRAALFDSDAIVWRDSVPTRGQDGPDAMVESMMKLLAPLHAVAALSRRAVSLGFADAKALCDAAEAGDARADAVWRDAARRIAGKLADLSVLLGIQRTAVGGSVGLRPGTLARLADEMQRRPA